MTHDSLPKDPKRTPGSPRQGRWLLVLAATIAAVTAIALSRPDESDGTPIAAGEPSALPAPAHPPANSSNHPSAASTQITGSVIETIDVGRYTYVKFNSPEIGEVWAAIPAAKLETGAPLLVIDAQRHERFTSHTLRRVFDVIYFGRLAGSSMPATSGKSPHHGPGGPPVTGPAEPMARAAGPLGRTVAEIHAERQKLAGQKVRVRGVVVRATARVMGRSFVHLQDGSGTEAQKNHDLTVTTNSEPGAGRTLEFEGVVATDRDFGAGYTYDVIVEDATLVVEPDGAHDG